MTQSHGRLVGDVSLWFLVERWSADLQEPLASHRFITEDAETIITATYFAL